MVVPRPLKSTISRAHKIGGTPSEKLTAESLKKLCFKICIGINNAYLQRAVTQPKLCQLTRRHFEKACYLARSRLNSLSNNRQ